MGDGFYRSKDPTNSIKLLKENLRCFCIICCSVNSCITGRVASDDGKCTVTNGTLVTTNDIRLTQVLTTANNNTYSRAPPSQRTSNHSTAEGHRPDVESFAVRSANRSSGGWGITERHLSDPRRMCAVVMGERFELVKVECREDAQSSHHLSTTKPPNIPPVFLLTATKSQLINNLSPSTAVSGFCTVKPLNFSALTFWDFIRTFIFAS